MGLDAAQEKELARVLEISFPGKQREVGTLPRARTEGEMVIVKVHANYESLDFQDRRHRAFVMLRASGMNEMCDRLSISQYRTGD